MIAAAVILHHLRNRGVRIDRTSEPSTTAAISLRHQIAIEQLTSKLEGLIRAELEASRPDGNGYLTPLLETAINAMMRDFEHRESPIEEKFRQRVQGELEDKDWSTVVLIHLADAVADGYLAAIYRSALHGELGWEPDAGTSPEAIGRAREAVEFLQRITRHNRRGRKPDDPEEVRQEIQRAVDCVTARGEKLTRHAVAAEMQMSPSGLDDRLRRHQLRISKDGQVEFSAIN